MSKYAAIDNAGLVTAILNCDDDVYYDGAVVFDQLYKSIDEIETPEPELLNSYYKGGFYPLPEKPSKYHVWDLNSESWIAPAGYLELIKADSKVQINQQARAKILSVYPQWKQSNMTARFMELMLASEENSAEGLWLQSAWAWIKNIRALSNVANDALVTAADIGAIRTIEQNYEAELAAVALPDS